MKPGDLVRLIDPHVYPGDEFADESVGLVVKIEKYWSSGMCRTVEVMWHQYRYHSADPSKLPRYPARALEVISESG